MILQNQHTRLYFCEEKIFQHVAHIIIAACGNVLEIQLTSDIPVHLLNSIDSNILLVKLFRYSLEAKPRIS